MCDHNITPIDKIRKSKILKLIETENGWWCILCDVDGILLRKKERKLFDLNNLKLIFIELNYSLKIKTMSKKKPNPNMVKFLSAGIIYRDWDI